ncbi:MAG: protein kinase [Verrucomicrobia bacterium]|nr:protein kinase [Verrucomicrobiota bacterium]
MIPSDSPDGNCPACLMRLAAGDDSTETAVVPASKHSDAPRSALDTCVATRYLGDYELLEEIARGGMGIVYKARQKSLDRIVAVKLLLFGELSSEAFIQRFRVEAQAAASLKHPNIVSIYEIGQDAGRHFFSMEYVEGQNLAQLVKDKPLSAKKAAGYVKAIAEAIHWAHEKGILHRDLKPSNVLVDSEDQVRVTDFGLAKRFVVPPSGGPAREPAEAGTTSDLTLTGQVLGTPNYLSPEQALARKEVGAATDVYALGGILYYLRTARPPFQAETLAETLQQVVNAEPVSPRLLNASVPVDLETICLKCLEKEAGRRYSSAEELAAELNRFLRDEPIRARPASRAEKLWRWCRRNPVMASLSAATVLLLVTVAVGSTLAAVRIARANQETRSREVALQQNLYVANMKVAQLALTEGNLALAQDLVSKYSRPAKGEDLRGFEWRYLWKLCQTKEQFTLSGHSNRIMALAFTPDGKRLSSSGYDGEVKLWDLEAKKELAAFPGTGNPVFSLDVLPNSRSIVIGAARLRGGQQFIGAGTMFSAMWLDAVSVREGPSFAEERFLPGAIGPAALSPDGRMLITDGTNGFIIWDATRWRKIDALNSSHRPDQGGPLIVRPAFSADGSKVALGVKDSQGMRVKLWNVSSLRSDGFREPPVSVFLPGTNDMSELAGLAFSPDGKILATGKFSGEIRLWDPLAGKSLSDPQPSTRITGMLFLQDNKTLVTCSYEHQLRVWDVSTRTNILPVTAISGHRNEIWALALSPDGKALATGSKDTAIKLWNTETLRHPPESNEELEDPNTRWLGFVDNGHTLANCVGHKEWCYVLAFSHDGSVLGSASRDNTAKLWRVPTGTLKADLTGHKNAVHRLAFSSDDRTLATVGPGEVKLWHVATGQENPHVEKESRRDGSCFLFQGWLLSGRRRTVEDNLVACAVVRRDRGAGTKVEFTYAVAAKLAHREQTVEGTAAVWSKMVAICDEIAQQIKAIEQRFPGSKAPFNRVLDFRNAAERRRELHS